MMGGKATSGMVLAMPEARTGNDELRCRLYASLKQRDLLSADADERGPLTIYGQPAWRELASGREPEPLMAASARQRALVACAHATPAAAPDRCALWIETAFARMGLGVVTGNASALYRDWCRLADPGELKVGMIAAVAACPYGAGGRAWGHVGLYIGDGRIMHCAGGRVLTAPFEAWASVYGVMTEPRWGWLGGIDLT